MQSLLQKIKHTLLFFSPLILISLIILWPSFNLHLTGDDYLGLWRYNYYLSCAHGGHWNNFNFFFTDYGPQDTITAIIHNFFGFQPLVYYIVSYIFRLFAALTFYPLVKYITKNRLAAYGSALFFAICATGLETTDWSFNMPSYLAIGFLNLFFLTLFNSIDKKSWKLSIASLFLFYITVISQPIRMVCIIPITTLILIFKTIQNYSFFNVKTNLLRFVFFIILSMIIFVTGYIGNSIGAGETLQERVFNGGWHKVVSNNFSALLPLLQQRQYEYLVYPVAQIGSIFTPDTSVPFQHRLLNESNILILFVVPSFILFLLFLFVGQKSVLYTKKPVFLLSGIVGLLWSALVWWSFFLNAQYPLSAVHFFDMLMGGYVLFFIFLYFIHNIKDRNLSLGIFLGVLVLIIPFATPWLRNPTFIYESPGRYLIISAAGLSILIGMFIKVATKNNYSLLFLIVISLFFALHMKNSFNYLYHLSTVRGITMTNNIRTSVPHVKGFGGKDPLVFYFEPEGSEVLHHALLFGFPVIMGAQYHFSNVWTIMYTDNWDEITHAYTDGSSLKRFSIIPQRVPLSNIYSFQLDGDHLVNTSARTRQRLQEENPSK